MLNELEDLERVRQEVHFNFIIDIELILTNSFMELLNLVKKKKTNNMSSVYKIA